jgi:hypothetical protein
VSSSFYERNWSNYSIVYNKFENRLQLKRAKDLVYVYTNSRLLAEEEEKDEKKWYADNVDSEDSDSAPEEEVEEHGDLDSDGWDDGNLGVRDSYGVTNRSPHAPRRDHAREPEDEYTFQDEEDEHLKDKPSIAAFVNVDGLLNSNNILRKSSTIEDIKDVSAIKANNMDEIGTKKEILPPRSLSRKEPAGGGGKNGEIMKKTIADASLKVHNASVKEKSDVEKFNPISSSGAKHGEGNNYGRGQQSPMSGGPSRALFESSSKNVGTVKLGSYRDWCPCRRRCTLESKRKMDIILLAMRIRLSTQYSREVNHVLLHVQVAYRMASNCKP